MLGDFLTGDSVEDGAGGAALGDEIEEGSRSALAGRRLDCCSRAAARGPTTTRPRSVSTGPAGGNGAQSAASSAALRRTAPASSSRAPSSWSRADTDTRMDIYERSGGTTTLLTTGPAGGNGAFNASFCGELRRRRAGVLPHLRAAGLGRHRHHAGPVRALQRHHHADLDRPGRGQRDVPGDLRARSRQDGSKVFFDTAESLVAGDTDGWRDVYQRSGGTTTLISTGRSAATAPFDATYAGKSRDGSHVFFHTDEPLEGSDVDTTQDVYERSGGATTAPVDRAGRRQRQRRLRLRRVLRRRLGGRVEGVAAHRRGAGRRRHRHGERRLRALRRGDHAGLRRASGGNGTARILRRRSARTARGSSSTPRSRWSAGDTDASTDIYERAGGTTTLDLDRARRAATARSSRPSRARPPTARACSSTPPTRWSRRTPTACRTSTSARGRDDHARLDRAAGRATAPFPPAFKGASRDGSRVFFDTSEHLVPASRRGIYPDIYERQAGDTTFLSLGPDGRQRRLLRVLRGRLGRRHARVLRDRRGARRRRHRQLAGRLLVLDHASAVRPPEGRGAAARVAGPGVRRSARRRTARTARRSRTPRATRPPSPRAQLTVGTPDANGEAANSVGSVKLQAVAGNAGTPADEADVRFTASITDVRLQVGPDRLHGRAAARRCAAHHGQAERLGARGPATDRRPAVPGHGACARDGRQHGDRLHLLGQHHRGRGPAGRRARAEADDLAARAAAVRNDGGPTASPRRRATPVRDAGPVRPLERRKAGRSAAPGLSATCTPAGRESPTTRE